MADHFFFRKWPVSSFLKSVNRCSLLFLNIYCCTSVVMTSSSCSLFRCPVLVMNAVFLPFISFFYSEKKINFFFFKATPLLHCFPFFFFLNNIAFGSSHSHKQCHRILSCHANQCRPRIRRINLLNRKTYPATCLPCCFLFYLPVGRRDWFIWTLYIT